MGWSLKIARIAGINVYVHVTFLIIVAWFTYQYYFAHGQKAEAAAYGAVYILSVFGVVVLHEFGHAMAARMYGVRTRDITLYLIGGVARLERMPEDPRQEFVVAVAGPAVNVVLAALCLLFMFKLPGLAEKMTFEAIGQNYLEDMFAVNVVLVLFNMIPAFPMDGGRVLRALLAMTMDYVKATQIAAGLGQFIAFGLGFLGLMGGNPLLLFVALFVWIAAGQESQTTGLRYALAGVPVVRAMIRQFHSLRPDQTLAEAADEILAGFQQDFPVVENGKVVGVLMGRDVFEGMRKSGENVPVSEAMCGDFVVADPYEMLESAYRRLQESPCRSMPVVHRGRLVGLLTPENISEYLMLREAVGR